MTSTSSQEPSTSTVFLSRTFASLAVIACALLATWGQIRHPERSAAWVFLALFLPVLWLIAETGQGGEKGPERQTILVWHRTVIAVTGLLLALSFGARLALDAGFLNPQWEPIAVRARGVLFGVVLAVWGNFLPKLLSPWSPRDEPFDWQGVHRFCGWAAALSGTAYAVVWLCMPIARAKPLAAGTVATFVVLALGRKLLSLATYSPPPTQ